MIVWALLLSHALAAQCPDGTPPPCGPRPALPVPELRKLTTSGRVQYVSVSPNGQMLAYVEDSVLWVRGLGEDGRAIVVSREASRFSYSFQSVMMFSNVRWLSDGVRIVAVGDSGTFMFPALGGPARRLAERALSAVSPDGRMLATLASSTRSIRVQNLESGAATTHTVPGAFRHFLEAAWSPAGRWLAAVTSDGVRAFALRSVNADGRSHLLLSDSVWLANPWWEAHTASLYYLRGEGARGLGPATQLWRLPVSEVTGERTGAPVLVMPAFESDRFSLARDGRDIVFRRAAGTSRTLEAALAPDTGTRLLTSGSVATLGALYSPDGRTLALVRGVDAGGASVFLTPTDSGSLERLSPATDRSVLFLDWSPSGDRLAYCSVGQGRPWLEVVSPRGGAPTRLDVPDIGLGCQFAWLPGDTLMYELPGNRNFMIRTFSSAGHERLVANDSVGFMNQPTVNPVNRSVAVFWNRGQQVGVWVIDRATGAQRLLLPAATPLLLRFSADGTGLYVVNERLLLKIGLGAQTHVDTIPTPRGCDVFEIRPDGRRVLCTEQEHNMADAWIIRDFDPTARRTAASP